MSRWPSRRTRLSLTHALACLLLTLWTSRLPGQSTSNSRVFPQSRSVIEKTLKSMQGQFGGRLPVLDGFAQGEHPMNLYQRGFYQAAADVSSVPEGTLVRISVKVTAWYSDPSGAHEGYQLLTSNGRLEADLLDQLAEQVVKNSVVEKKSNVGETRSPAAPLPEAAKPDLPAAPSGAFSSAWKQSLATPDHSIPRPTQDALAEKAESALQSEADTLEQALKGQSRPKNLVAVKKSGTPVVSTPSLSAKPLFLASLHDEFELLDFNEDWVHVRISGLSRGWIWRNSLEMPEGVPDTAAHSGPAPSPAADLFHVTREEAAQFPGDWQPLRGKTVKIISVQKVDEAAKDNGPKDKLEYAKYLLEKNLGEVTQKQQELAGIVLIFDSADGGMIAATSATLQQWKAGTLSDAALWHNCFFDPPETFTSGGNSAAQ